MQKSSPTAASQQGFTLVEVMMASLVMVMMFIAALASIQQGFTMIDTARNTTLAGQIIQSEIEDLRLKQYLSLPASGPIDLATTIGSGLSEAERTALSTRFTATRQVVDVPGRTGTAPDGTPIATLKRVIIAVEWRDYSHRLHSRAYETLVGYNGLSDYFATTHGASSP